MEDVLDKLAQLSPKEILGYAIASEEDAKRFYETLASTSGALLGDFFRELAKAEEGHRAILIKLHETLFGDTSYVVPEGIPFAETSVKVDTVANLIEAMRVALVNEKTAERIYRHLGEVLPEHRGIFGFLAAQERAHYASIRSHVEYLEDLTQGQPEYVNAPVEFFGAQLELYLGPRTRR
ncbi:ferritin family protein [Thermococcus sp. MAR1]|uniref:ferritin-like domain-containing protein n=1 Tax=Thermococcus sp. MAR1 TaxID=1638263 RepID=UPI0014392434|nr:ferritin family protein [Thermococcus sp. MAR1]NJE10499.1 rubrerythrin [Thermococcus sp. MAR1]